MYQQITIVGYLGNDPEMRFMPNGQAVTSFSVATSNKYTSNTGQRVDETTWFRVSVWGAQAESCNQYLKRVDLFWSSVAYDPIRRPVIPGFSIARTEHRLHPLKSRRNR